ncbi:WalW protein [Sphingomonas sp. TX0543]|uniref:WalW protein n=1 Tax=unclassified Sphingomonas TaxID=196159 RepID=UPI0020160FC5|nr:WalW protein [Sphingomonas sp. 3P27F8]
MASPAIVPRRWRVPPPEAETLVRWPIDFGVRYTVFIDTEEEFDWAAPFSRDAGTVTALAALPEAHRRLSDAGAAPAYFIDYPVASDPGGADLLRSILSDNPRAAIGAQLHPWVNPPFDEPLSSVASFAGNLPGRMLEEKLVRLTGAIAGAFERAPRAFRAGRYGLSPEMFGMLARHGYQLDSSVRPGFDYRAEGGPDFTHARGDAWRVSEMIELPLSTVFTGALRRHGARLHARLGAVPRGRGLFSRAGLLARVPLTPEGVPLNDALEAIAIAIGEGARVLNFAFHSPSLVPGNTPYVRDRTDLARFWRWWDHVLDELDRRGVRSASLDEVIAAAG